MTTPNLLGTGLLPPKEEAKYIAEGVRFAYFVGEGKERFVVTTRCASKEEAGAKFLMAFADQDNALPARYRIPEERVNKLSYLVAFVKVFDWPPLLYFALAPFAGIVVAWIIGVLVQ